MRKTQKAGKKRDNERFRKIKERHRKTFEEALQKGKIDEPMEELCGFIAQTKNYFTSSHCSGRIMLLKAGFEEEKKEAVFYRKWHRKITAKELIEAIESCDESLWFKEEPFIIHIGCGTIENAQKLMKLKDSSGIKRGGIIVLQEGKIMFELTGTGNISVPVMENGKMLVAKEFLEILANTANNKLEKNFIRIKKLTENAEKMLD